MKNYLKNTICIDLTKFNYAQLATLVAEYDVLDLNVLVQNKKDGFAKVFIDKLDGSTIAYTTKKDKTIVFTSDFTKALAEMTSVALVKEPKVMELDTILEKISKYGKQSLKADEIEFLKNL